MPFYSMLAVEEFMVIVRIVTGSLKARSLAESEQ